MIFAIRRYRDLKREVARRTTAEHKARELAYQDPLTGLANRRQFEEALAKAIGSPPDTGYSHAVFLLDLNGFKQINDNWGHGAGDEVLIVTAQRLLGAVRDGDLVARLGGDEFVVLARHLLGPEAATSVALRMLQAFEMPIATGSAEHRNGAGIGIALIPADADTAEEALRRADVALYRAKAERRSTFRFFEEEMDRLLRERERMERALEKALEEGRIEPRFNPSFDLKSGRVVGFEAVPSWTTDTGEDVPPERFLPIAEETGLIHDLAIRVLEQACRAAAKWPSDVTLSMDVLPGQIKDPNLGHTILDILARTGFVPHRLEIEIAENIVVHDLEAAKVALAPLRDAGISIALDNFGTGYSNLYHMREFRIDKVKIARRLIENMGEAETDRMVRALAGLGQGLGIAVSAEGMANAAEGSVLLSAGVREGQDVGNLVTTDGAYELATSRT
nr:EAL domain-containing protein [Luteimonas sp. BDR2-5]